MYCDAPINNAHTTTHTLFPGLRGWEARDSEWQWHQLSRMQVCTSLQTDNHASTPPLSFYRPDALPAAQPTASRHWMHNTAIKYCRRRRGIRASQYTVQHPEKCFGWRWPIVIICRGLLLSRVACTEYKDTASCYRLAWSTLCNGYM